MKLSRFLSVGNQPFGVVTERVLLKLNGSGSARFVIDASGSKAQAGDPVAFDIGYTRHNENSRLFLGYIEKAVDMDSRRQNILCREISNVLAIPAPLDIRHVSAKTVLARINQITGLNFSIPDKSYSTERKPNFYNLGDGFQALQHLPRVYRIDDFIWQQQGNGIVYAGSWSDSRWAGRSVELPPDLLDNQLSSGTARIPAIPVLRPGVQLNGRRITQLEFENNHMTVSWTPQ